MMMHRVPLGILLLLATSVLLAAAMPVEIDWEPRLEALDPRSPMSYFELGEEIADAADNVEVWARLMIRLVGESDGTEAAVRHHLDPVNGLLNYDATQLRSFL